MNFKILQASSGLLGSDQLEWGHPPSSTPQLWLWVNPECVCVEGGPGCRRVLAQFSSSPYTKVFGYWCHFSKFLQLENVEQYPKKMHIRQKENMETSFWRRLAWVPLFWNFSSPHPSERTRKCSEQRRGLLMDSYSYRGSSQRFLSSMGLIHNRAEGPNQAGCGLEASCFLLLWNKWRHE